MVAVAKGVRTGGSFWLRNKTRPLRKFCSHNVNPFARYAVPYRISGHETFPCRYAWLPKAVRGVQRNPKLFSDEQKAMVDLGVGKNMVRAIRFWSQAAGLISASKGSGHSVTRIGNDLLGDGGTDSFLEDIRTLWLIHWKLSTNIESPLLAWDYLLNRWQEPEIVPSAVMKALQNEVAKQDEKLSPVTLQEH
jgi:hypothetical protein